MWSLTPDQSPQTTGRISQHFSTISFRKSEETNFTDHLKFCCLTILQQRHTRTNSRALSLTSENRGKEVPSEADVVVIGKNSSHLSLQVFIAISRWRQSWLPDPVPPGQAGRDQHRPAGEGAVDGRSVHNKRPP